MFQIKICGITSPEDALLAAEAGADAIGLNFYEQSPRYVTPEKAKGIVHLLRTRFDPDRLRIAGVFVNSAVEQILSVLTAADLRELSSGSAIQLHGDELPAVIERLLPECEPSYFSFRRANDFSGRVILIRAFRCTGTDLGAVRDYLKECNRSTESWPHAVLLDAYAPGAYGGTGQVVDWNVVRNERDLLMGLPVILAGGLTPENVAEAIATARPDAVDVASGVESSPGKKDPDKVRRFIAEARRAFASLPERRTDN